MKKRNFSNKKRKNRDFGKENLEELPGGVAAVEATPGVGVARRKRRSRGSEMVEKRRIVLDLVSKLFPIEISRVVLGRRRRRHCFSSRSRERRSGFGLR